MNNNGSNNNKKIPRDGKKKVYTKKKKIVKPANRKATVAKQKKCQNCSSIDRLSAHHIVFRSSGLDDSLENLITLCFSCHRKVHDGIHTKEGYITGKEFIIMILKKTCKTTERYINTLERLIK